MKKLLLLVFATLVLSCNGMGNRVEPCVNTGYADLDGTFYTMAHRDLTLTRSDGTTEHTEEEGGLRIYSDQCGNALIFFCPYFTAVGNVGQFGAPLHFDINSSSRHGFAFHAYAEGYIERDGGWLDFTVEYEFATYKNHWWFEKFTEIAP